MNLFIPLEWYEDKIVGVRRDQDHPWFRCNIINRGPRGVVLAGPDDAIAAVRNLVYNKDEQ